MLFALLIVSLYCVSCDNKCVNYDGMAKTDAFCKGTVKEVSLSLKEVKKVQKSLEAAISGLDMVKTLPIDAASAMLGFALAGCPREGRKKLLTVLTNILSSAGDFESCLNEHKWLICNTAFPKCDAENLHGVKPCRKYCTNLRSNKKCVKLIKALETVRKHGEQCPKVFKKLDSYLHFGISDCNDFQDENSGKKCLLKESQEVHSDVRYHPTEINMESSDEKFADGDDNENENKEENHLDERKLENIMSTAIEDLLNPAPVPKQEQYFASVFPNFPDTQTTKNADRKSNEEVLLHEATVNLEHVLEDMHGKLLHEFEQKASDGLQPVLKHAPKKQLLDNLFKTALKNSLHDPVQTQHPQQPKTRLQHPQQPKTRLPQLKQPLVQQLRTLSAEQLNCVNYSKFAEPGSICSAYLDGVFVKKRDEDMGKTSFIFQMVYDNIDFLKEKVALRYLLGKRLDEGCPKDFLNKAMAIIASVNTEQIKRCARDNLELLCKTIFPICLTKDNVSFVSPICYETCKDHVTHLKSCSHLIKLAQNIKKMSHLKECSKKVYDKLIKIDETGILNNCVSLPEKDQRHIEQCQLLPPTESSKETSKKCFKPNSVIYIGDLSSTTNGKSCIEWDHRHLPKIIYPHLQNNYCRNPQGYGDKPWCYYSTNGDWEYCNVDVCKEEKGHLPVWKYAMIGLVLAVTIIAVIIFVLYRIHKKERDSDGASLDMDKADTLLKTSYVPANPATNWTEDSTA